ncbi:MAG: type II secretion system GspH family protein [Deferribacteraceae bacterium]|jgi:competence protein ComGF|nr:type II secretion system GspH family protein [Deferribacteraceae bacterium]
MNKTPGFTLIQMAALIMIIGIALVVLARYFTADYTANHYDRHTKAVNEAEKDLRFYFANYRIMPKTTNTDINGTDHSDKSFMVYDELEGLNRRFNPVYNSEAQLLYISAQKRSFWDGDICSTLPHPPTIPAIYGEDNFSVSLAYCEGELLPDGTCDAEKYRINGLLYIIAHPGDDKVFSSKITDNTLYVPLKNNDDIIRYLPLKEGYDIADCPARAWRIPRQDKRYTNRDMKADATTHPNTSPPIIRTYTSVDENTKAPSVCEVPKEDLHTSLLTYVLCSAINTGEGGSADSRYSSCKVRFDAIKCLKSRVEYPLNRFGESFPFEKCCIELEKSRFEVNIIHSVPLSSNCSVKFRKNGEQCRNNDENSWNDLKGETPYLEFFSGLVGIAGQPTDRNDIPMNARLLITLANGNRYYRLSNDATIHRVPTEIPD